MTPEQRSRAGRGSEAASSSNSSEALAPMLADGRITLGRVCAMLALRSVVSFGLLLTLAALFGLTGQAQPFTASAAWWLWFVTAANIACLVLMLRFSRQEGLRLRDLYFARKSTWRVDLLWALLASVGVALFAMLPGTLLAGVLWEDGHDPNARLIQAIPLVAVYPLFVFLPITQALAELPTYWGYVAPRLRASGMGRWSVLWLVGGVLSVQHMFFAFQLDWRYDLWLALKFLPFALWTGFIVDRRPSTLPYLMGLHFALDAALPVLLLFASTS